MIDWDEKKNKVNKEKHGFSFDEIIGVFDDPNLIESYDSDHSTIGEDRFKCIGSLEGLLIILVEVSEDEGTRRIISARKATLKERACYYENYKETT